jgi:two-component system KDP operon response regulator KdpE
METPLGKSRVLVVNREAQSAAVLRYALLNERYDVRGNVLAAFSDWRPELVIADVPTTPMRGIELCRQMRAASAVAIIVLSDDSCEHSIVVALDSGADDYIVKRFGSVELMARIRAALRRAAPAECCGSLDAGDFRVDFDCHRVYARAGEVRLTPKEFDLFVQFARFPNGVLRHAQLLSAMWGEEWCDHLEYLRVFIRQLRLKLEDDARNPRYLVTEPWVGYRFNPRGSS